MLNENQKFAMAYFVMRITLQQILDLPNPDYRGDGAQLCDAKTIALKAMNAVKELEEVK